MKWFKHFTDWHRDPDVLDGYARFEHFAYVYLQCLRETFADFFESRDERGYIRVSLRHMTQRCRTRPGKFLEVSAFFRERKRIDYYRDGEFLMIKLLDFERLIGHWRQRRDNTDGAPVVHCHGDEEEKREEEKIYEEQKKEEESVVCVANEILDYFNKKTGKNFNNPSLILTLLREGRKKEDFLHIIDVKSEDDFFRKNRRLFNPQTFFSGDHFEKYLQEYHDRENTADTPSKNPSLPAPVNKEKEIAYYQFLKKECPSLQSGFIQLLTQYNLLDFLKMHGFNADDYGFAVVSLENNILRIFSPSSFPGYTTLLGIYLKEEAGITLEYVWTVPDDFVPSSAGG